MICPNCEKLRAALSPLEDRVFTEHYLASQPTDWLRDNHAAGFTRVTLGMLFSELTQQHAALRAKYAVLLARNGGDV